MTTPTLKTTTGYTPANRDFLLLPFCSAKTACFPREMLPEALAEALRTSGDKGGAATVFTGAVSGKKLHARTVRLDAEHTSPEAHLRKAVATALDDARTEGSKRVVVLMDVEHAAQVEAIQEGALAGGYVFDRYLSDKKKPLPLVMGLSKKTPAALKRRLDAARKVIDSVNFARDVLNEPPNVIKPPSLAKAFRAEGRKAGLKVSVWDDKRLEREKCGGILGVGQGAKAKPRLVIAEYKPQKAKKHLCLVGKGVTFDTGGYCLKPTAAQLGMKYDMGGAAMMFAAACAIARLKLPIRVTCLTPLAENAISGEAYLTTSVLTTRSGRTVEVHNTDAEGRLILADALTLAGERKPDYIVDAATLTGACVVALGQDIAAAYGADATFTQQLIAAAREVGERFWEMPLHRPYGEQLKTTIADCKNVSSSRYGGSITAALFLQKWVPEGTKWIHCDIAGPGCKEDPLDHLGKGSKGFGVKAMVALAREVM